MGPWLLSLFTALGAAGSPTASDEPSRPNVLFLISDDLSAEALGCYGNEICRTPHIDALAARGTRFDAAFCQFPICGASRAALMSGMYPQAIGVMGNGGAGKFGENLGERPSWSQWFIRNGYFAARVGKIYHMRVPGDLTAGVSGPDHAASWTERHDCPGPEWRSTGQHAHLSIEKLKRDADRHYNLGFGSAFYVVRTDGDGLEQPDVKAADRAIAILERVGGGASSTADSPIEAPFFLAVGFVRPHVPLVAPAAEFEPYDPSTIDAPPLVEGDLLDIPSQGRSRDDAHFGLDRDPARKGEVLAAYYASVSFMDRQVGRILGALERLGLAEDTIVIFTSDHGYHLGEHGFWQKMSLHEESVRIPLILARPGDAPRHTEGLAQQIDLYPTLSRLCGLSVPPHVQGRSLEPLLDSEHAEVHREVYCARGRGAHLLRTPRWAYLRHADQTRELYDMLRDPRQYTNLATSAAHLDILQRLDDRLEAKLAEIGSRD